MTSASYCDPRLAAVYDPLNPPGPDNAFYLALAGERPQTLLDIGCGTGWLAVDLAARGHRVTGADPAAAMLEIARRRPGGQRVTWVESAAADLDLSTRFDLAIMTGHAFQVFLSDEAALAALRTLRRHLAPRGRLAFETRNPAVRAWERWLPLQTRTEVEVPGVGRVGVAYDLTAVEGAVVTYKTHFRFGPGDFAAAESRLRFWTREELAACLAAAGFADLVWYGDWDRSPIGPGSPEIIVVAG